MNSMAFVLKHLILLTCRNIGKLRQRSKFIKFPALFSLQNPKIHVIMIIVQTVNQFAEFRCKINPAVL